MRRATFSKCSRLPSPQPLVERTVVEVEVQDVAARCGEVVNLEPEGVHAVAVTRVHPFDLYGVARERAECGGDIVEHYVAGGGARRRTRARQRMTQKERGFREAPDRELSGRCPAARRSPRTGTLDKHAERSSGVRGRAPFDRRVESGIARPPIRWSQLTSSIAKCANRETPSDSGDSPTPAARRSSSRERRSSSSSVSRVLTVPRALAARP